ncbi:MAG: HoxN/HupN/NixA family nickel/cobalt transporter [Vulcanimicrobiaceae bacterium]
MMGAGAFTVFALGLRHGADPDHLAAIDNMTRNSVERRPILSRFIGTIFAGGHTIMVLAIAALIGYLGARFSAHSRIIETIGTIVSIVVLLLIAALNLRQLVAGQTDRVAGAKTRLLPRCLRNASSPWVAIPVGMLFGFGFETSSQVAAYAVAFGIDAGVTGALVVGSMFCVGMACTDTLDSLFVHRVVTYRAGRLPEVMRVWIWAVTLFAVAVAAYESAQLAGWKPPVSDLAISAIAVATLLAIFAWVFLATCYGANAMKTRLLGGLAVLAALVLALTLYLNYSVRASDHQDSPVTAGRPGADITDPYIFPAPDNRKNVVLVMNVHSLIPSGQGGSIFFDPGVVYQMNFDGVDENASTPSQSITQSFIIQFSAGTPGPNQPIFVYGPGHPTVTGNQTELIKLSGQGTINTPFTVGDMHVFAGAREDPFFFDLAQFLKILPDRNGGSTATSCLPKLGNGTCPQGFNDPGSDTLKGFNVLSLVVELPRADLIAGCGGPRIAYWVTTNTSTGN